MTILHVVIAAGGAGARFGAAQKKQFLEIAGKSLLQHAVDFFLSYDGVRQIVVVLPQDELQRQSFNDARVRCVAGGTSRAESVKNGILALQDAHEMDCILVHDAARPNVSAALVDRVVQKVVEYGAAIPTLAVTDTLKQVKDERLLKTIDRSQMRAAQTPQGARWSFFKQIYQNSNMDLARVTDEAMLLEEGGFEVFWVEGDRANIKVTTPLDLQWLQFLSGDCQK